MNWLKNWVERGDPKTIDQDLELLIGRWSQRGMTDAEIANRLLVKVAQMEAGKSPSP